MPDVITLADKGAIGLAIATLIILAWLINKFLSSMVENQKFMSETLQRVETLQNKTVNQLSKAVDKNTKATSAQVQATIENTKLLSQLVDRTDGISHALSNGSRDLPS